MKSLKSLYFLYLLLFCIPFSFSQNKEDIQVLLDSFRQIRFINFDKAHANATKAVAFSKKISDKRLELLSYRNLSEILYLQKQHIEAEKNLTKAFALAEEINDKTSLASLYNLLGSLQKRNNDYTTSLATYKKAITFAEKYDPEELYNIQTNLARLYWAIGDAKNAKEILQTTIPDATKSNQHNTLADAYNILGVISLEKNKDSALFFYKKARDKARQMQNLYLEARIISSIGDLYVELNDHKNSLRYLNESEKLSTQVGDKSSLHYIHMSLGRYYEKNGNYKEATKKYELAIEKYGEFVDDYQKIYAYGVASGIYYHTENYKKAYLYLDKYFVLNDTITSLEKKKEFEEIRTQYEVEKKENTITLLEKENELAAIQTKNTRIIFISTTVIFVLLLIFYMNRVKNQKKIRSQEKEIHKNEKEKLEKENELKKIQGYVEGQEKEKNRIAIELHDGIAGGLAGVKHLLSTANTPEIEKASHHIGVLTKNVRSLSHHLSSNYITNNPFTTLLTDLKNNYNSSNQFTIEITFFPNDYFYNLNNEYKHHLYRITQELLHNIAKHAQAKNVSISFAKHKEYFSFIVEDDGIGFSYDEKTIGIGLKNNKERVLLLNGKMHIDSKKKKGTTVSIEIPV